MENEDRNVGKGRMARIVGGVADLIKDNWPLFPAAGLLGCAVYLGITAPPPPQREWTPKPIKVVAFPGGDKSPRYTETYYGERLYRGTLAFYDNNDSEKKITYYDDGFNGTLDAVTVGAEPWIGKPGLTLEKGDPGFDDWIFDYKLARRNAELSSR